MISSKPSHASLLFLFLFSLSSFFNLSCSYTGNNAIFCPEIEKNSLLIFKQSLKDPYKLLSSWDGEVNCCQWHGVICNNSTGHVHELHLQASSDQFPIQGLSGKLNPSLLDLKHLTYLDLSLNSFSQTIPPFLGSFVELEYLSLSNAGFHGKIPHVIGNLSSLHSLNFESKYGGQLDVDSLEWLWGLSKLEYLNMNSVDLSRTTNWAKAINTLPSLKEVNFSGCSLEPIAPVHEVNTTSSLTSINLSHNYIHSFAILTWILQLSHLVFLDLSWNSFEGPIQLFCNATKLQHIDLSYNSFSSTIPDCLYLFKDLELLDLSSNRFSGLVPRVGGPVEELDLSDNSFTGGMSHFLCDTTYETYGLQILHFWGNQLSGELPDCWKRWPSLEYLNLGNNNLFGSIPHSMGYLGQLRSLNLNNNKLSAQLPFSLHNCTALIKIDLADNNLDGNIPAWVGTSLIHLTILILRSNKLSGNISSNICFLNSLIILDLSDNKVSGMIPRCVYNFTAMATKRSLVDDFEDRFDYAFVMGSFIDSASVATKGAQLQYDTILSLVTNIDLSKNNLSGHIPEELASLVELRSLNLSENQLTGVIPDGIGDMRQLESLDLSMNSLSGQIPNSITLLSSLAYLNLSFNKLTGKIPESTQISGFHGSSFIGNNLCGPPLTRYCSNGSTNRPHENKTEGDHKGEVEWLYVFLSLGYAVGFSVICTALVLKKRWRDAYFGWLECMWDKVYVFVCIQWKRLMKPSAPTP